MRIMQKVKEFFSRELFSRTPVSLLKGQPHIYEFGGGWGNAINWQDVDRGEVVGWKHRIPEVGDEIRSRMKSGKTGRFVFVAVRRCGDPPDMFFATVSFIGYVEA